MKGFVLAAGFGQRMRPLTESVPKPCLPVGNLPLVTYALKLLARYGIHEVAINTHHLSKSIEDALGDGSAYGVNLHYSHEDEILGTGGGLKEMGDFLDETFVVLNSDIIINLELDKVIETHRKSQAISTMVLRSDPKQSEKGLIEIDETGRIRRILGQGDPADDLKAYMFTGVHVMEPQFLEYIPAGVKTCVNRYGYTKALKNDVPLFGVVTDCYWRDFGTPKSYLEGNFDALEQSMGLAYADPLAGFALAPRKEVAEVVRLGNDVQLGADVTLLPPVVIGNGSKIGDNATVGPHCVVGSKVSVGKQARIRKAVVLEGAKVEAGADITEAVVHKKGHLPGEDLEVAPKSA